MVTPLVLKVFIKNSLSFIIDTVGCLCNGNEVKFISVLFRT